MDMFINLITMVSLITYTLLVLMFVFSNIGNMKQNTVIKQMKLLFSISFILLISNFVMLFNDYIDPRVSLLSIIVFGGSFIFFLFKSIDKNNVSSLYKNIYMVSLFVLTINTVMALYKL